MFYVNLPVGIAAFALVAVAMIEPLQHQAPHRLDCLGIVTLLAWTILLVFALGDGRPGVLVGLVEIIGCFAAARCCSPASCSPSSAPAEPPHPVRPLLGQGPARVGRSATVFIGMAMFGVMSFLPLFVQVVIGDVGDGAGQVLTPMMLAMMVGSASGARIVLKVGFRPRCASSGFSLLAGGVFLLTRLGVGSTRST